MSTPEAMTPSENVGVVSFASNKDELSVIQAQPPMPAVVSNLINGSIMPKMPRNGSDNSINRIRKDTM